MTTKRLSASITIGGTVTGALKSALGTTRDKFLEVGSVVRKLDREQRTLSNSIATFGRMGSNVDGLRTRYVSVTTELERQRGILAQLSTLEKAREANAGRRREMKSQIGSTVAVSAGVLFPTIATLKKSAEFNYQLQLIANTAEMTKLETVKLGEAVMEASRKAGQSAPDMLKAIGFLVAAGMQVKTAQDTVLSVGRTATAFGGDVEDLAKAAYVLNDSLKIDPKNIQGALDILAQSGKEGNVELKDMAKVLPVLGSGFVSLKMQGREAAATIGAALQIARKGAGDADEAANNMKNYIAKVMSPETLKKAKKEFNLDLYQVIQDAQKTGGNPFEASMTAIIKATKGDQKAIGELFGDMQVQNFIRPMIQNWEKYQEIKAKALAANGVSDRDFAKVMALAKKQIDEASNASGRLGIAIGNALEPAIGSLASALTPVIDRVTGFVDRNRELVGNSLLVVGGLSLMKIGTLAASLAINVLRGGVISTIGALARLAPLASVVGTATTVAAGGVTLLGRALMVAGKGVLWLGRALLLNPIGLAVTAIAGGAFLIYKNWGELAPKFSALWTGIKTTFTGVYDWILGRVARLLNVIGKVKGAIGSVFDGGVAPGEMQTDAMGNPTGVLLSPEAPSLPTLATARGGGPSTVDNSQMTLNITQLPGQSARQLADVVIREIENRNGVRRNGMMVDGVAAQ